MKFVKGAAILAMAAFAVPSAFARDISIQSQYPPLQFTDSTPGGAHPIGGASKNFVDIANALPAPHDLKLKFHVSGKINKADEGTVEPPIVNPKDWGNLIKAVAAGPENGGLVASTGIPADSDIAFGEFFSGGIPFALTADEWLGFLYGGGGLELHQKFYDEKFDGKVKVIPVGLSPSQTAGFFPKPIPVPGPGKTAEQAMAEFCDMPLIVRYPIGARYILTDTCKAVGKEVGFIGKQTRCEDATAVCGPENPANKIVNEPKFLTFGGFTPGVIPHTMYANGNITAFELSMPSDHIQFFKLAAKKQNEKNAQVDISKVVPPYHYLTSWHQSRVYVELVFNKAEWNKLSEAERLMIEAAARASMVTTYGQRLAVQGDALAILAKNGVTNLRWPDGLMDLMKKHADAALDRLAREEEAKGDDTLTRALAAVRAYKAQNAAYFDADDIGQGTAPAPEHP